MYFRFKYLHVTIKQTCSSCVFFYFFRFSEGFIAAEDLAFSFEKSWLGLHIQVHVNCFSLTYEVVYPSIHIRLMVSICYLLIP